jgi:glyoxylase-like metal-dependent hydrolase (beta-lactamase superfamily II)
MTLPDGLRSWRLPCGAALLVLLAGCASTPAPDAQAALERAERALGAAAVRTLHFSGSGTGSTFGQAHQPQQGWPGLNYSVLSRQVDYDNAALREDFARSRSEPTGGGATPLMGQGEARATAFLSGALAWNGSGAAASAAPVALEARVHDLWTTPHGAVKAARRHALRAEARREDGTDYTAVSFTEPGRFEATLWIDPQGLVPRIDARVPHPVLGDSSVTTRWSGWRVLDGGVRFPTRLQQSQGGFPTLDITIADVKINAPVEAAVPDAVRAFTERVNAERVADGVWYLTGGSHHSVLVELRDQLVLVEAPLYDGRTQAVLAKAAELVPGKPVRTVVNSHHHFDHAGGLRAAAASGATLVTSALARPWFEKTLANPNRIAPDALARSGRTPTIVGVAGAHVITDGQRSVEVHEMQDSIHAQGFLMVWLPRERLLVQADAYTPGPPGSPPPPAPNANHVTLVRNIERLGLPVERILPLHGRMVPMAELLAAIGRR